MNEQNIEKKLKESVKKLEKAPVSTPGFSFFTDLVRRENRKLEKSRKTQFRIFSFLSVFIVAAGAVCMLLSAGAFLSLQAAALLAVAAVLLYSYKAEARK